MQQCCMCKACISKAQPLAGLQALRCLPGVDDGCCFRPCDVRAGYVAEAIAAGWPYAWHRLGVPPGALAAVALAARGALAAAGLWPHAPDPHDDPAAVARRVASPTSSAADMPQPATGQSLSGPPCAPDPLGSAAAAACPPAGAAAGPADTRRPTAACGAAGAGRAFVQSDGRAAPADASAPCPAAAPSVAAAAPAAAPGAAGGSAEGCADAAALVCARRDAALAAGAPARMPAKAVLAPEAAPPAAAPAGRPWDPLAELAAAAHDGKPYAALKQVKAALPDGSDVTYGQARALAAGVFARELRAAEAC